MLYSILTGSTSSVQARGKVANGSGEAVRLDLAVGLGGGLVDQLGEPAERRVVVGEAEAQVLRVEGAVIVPGGGLDRVVLRRIGLHNHMASGGAPARPPRH